MKPKATSKNLSAHLDDADARASSDLGETQQVVNRLSSEWPGDRGVFAELRRLAEFIARTREEVNVLRPDEVTQEFIPKATDHLDAIVEATATATHRIMDAADVVMELVGRLDSNDAEKATAAVMSIYEACTFQDITGQRVTKVIAMLKVIEGRLDGLIAAMGECASGEECGASAASSGSGAQRLAASEPSSGSPGVPTALSDGASTLDGPALPGEGKTQVEVDALLAGGE